MLQIKEKNAVDNADSEMATKYAKLIADVKRTAFVSVHAELLKDRSLVRLLTFQLYPNHIPYESSF